MSPGGGWEAQQKLRLPASSLHSAGVSQTAAATKVSGTGGVLMNDGLERASKERLVAGFEYYHSIWLEQPMKITENLSNVNQSKGQDLKLKSSEHEMGLPSTEWWRLVQC